MTGAVVKVRFACGEPDGLLLRDFWEDAITRIDLTVGRRTGPMITAETGAPDDKDRR